MDTRRQSKIAQLIKEVFGEILIKEGKNYIGNTFVTLANVKVTSDMGIARMYISVYGSQDNDKIIQTMNEHKYDFRRILGNKMRHDLRKIPDLEFYLDDTLDYVDKIDKIFKDIHDSEAK